MCFGGGSSAPVKDPEAERQQELQREKEQKEIKENKARVVERTVVVNQPLASAGPKEPDTVSSALTKSGMPRKRIKGAQSLITGSRGGKGFYSKFG